TGVGSATVIGTSTSVPVVAPVRVSTCRPAATPGGRVTVTAALPASSEAATGALSTAKVPSTDSPSDTSTSVSFTSAGAVKAQDDTLNATSPPGAYAAGEPGANVTPTARWL